MALNATYGTENQNSSVENSQGAFDFDGKIDVTWGVDQVDDIVVPEQLGGRRGDGDPPFLLQFHVIHRRTVATAFDFFDLMDTTCVEQDPLAKGGFA